MHETDFFFVSIPIWFVGLSQRVYFDHISGSYSTVSGFSSIFNIKTTVPLPVANILGDADAPSYSPAYVRLSRSFSNWARPT